jgi:hypothetical protein
MKNIRILSFIYLLNYNVNSDRKIIVAFVAGMLLCNTQIPKERKNNSYVDDDDNFNDDYFNNES